MVAPNAVRSAAVFSCASHGIWAEGSNTSAEVPVAATDRMAHSAGWSLRTRRRGVSKPVVDRPISGIRNAEAHSVVQLLADLLSFLFRPFH